jgi:hypothetical protein
MNKDGTALVERIDEFFEEKDEWKKIRIHHYW